MIKKEQEPPYYRFKDNVKVYIAQISQGGTDAPIENVFVNTLGTKPIYTRTGAGEYNIESDVFKVAKIAMNIQTTNSNSVVTLNAYADNNIILETRDIPSGNLLDGRLNNATLIIKVFDIS